jgi:hypothetical protein
MKNFGRIGEASASLTEEQVVKDAAREYLPTKKL